MFNVFQQNEGNLPLLQKLFCRVLFLNHQLNFKIDIEEKLIGVQLNNSHNNLFRAGLFKCYDTF